MKQYLTRREVTEACDAVYDTVRRWEKTGLLPNTRTRPDGAIEIAVADLVAAGKLDPPVNEVNGSHSAVTETSLTSGRAGSR